MRFSQSGKAWEQQPLNQAFAGADNEFYRLAGTGAAKFFEGAERVADDFIESLAGICECSGAMAALEQLDAEIALEFLELAAELALAVRVIARGCGDAAAATISRNVFKRSSERPD